MSEVVNYIDILKPRNTQFGIFKFMTRFWDPKKTVSPEKYYSPQDIKKIVAESVYIDAYLEAESVRNGVSKEKLRKEVLEYLEEIAMDKKMHVIRWMGIMFLKVCFLMKIGVFVNEPAILKIKSNMGKNPVLFLPTHRSYADFCLMTYLCFHYDIELPAVAAGMDFYSMAVVGQSMRETGAFYIRRTLVGSPLYAATLRHYVRTLVAKHHVPVEFFLEGTRSRSNKSLPPKYGMLSMTLVPYFAREVSDVTIVPVNISYDRLVEQGLFAYEHLGVPKPKETTGGLLKSLYRLNDHYGNIYINLGEPISIRDFIGQSLPVSSETLKPLDLQQLTGEQFNNVQEIANYTVAMQQSSTVVTISNLVCIVLMDSLMRNEAMHLEQVYTKIEWLIQVLRGLGASVFENNVKASVDRILVVHKKLIKLDNDKKLRLLSSTLMNVSPEVQKKMKGHILKAETMVNAVPVIELQLYVNPVLHYLVPPAIVYLAVLKGQNTMEGLSTDYHRLRKLLRHEFFHLENTENETFKRALEYCVQRKVITDTLRPGSDEALQFLLRWTVAPALTTLAHCADVMAERWRCEEREALRLVQARAERSGAHPYCLSLESGANCLRGLALSNALLRRTRNQQLTYEAVGENLESCRQFINAILSNVTVQFDNANTTVMSREIKAKL